MEKLIWLTCTRRLICRRCRICPLSSPITTYSSILSLSPQTKSIKAAFCTSRQSHPPTKVASQSASKPTTGINLFVATTITSKRSFKTSLRSFSKRDTHPIVLSRSIWSSTYAQCLLVQQLIPLVKIVEKVLEMVKTGQLEATRMDR